jgi:hypothetical protein
VDVEGVVRIEVEVVTMLRFTARDEAVSLSQVNVT